MTLIASLVGPQGIVMATDSRGTIGDPRGLTAINDVQIKLFKISNFCGISVSGSSELAVRIIDQLRAVLSGQSVDPKDVDAIMAASVTFMKREYTSWFGHRPWVTSQPMMDHRPALIFIMAGYKFEPDGTAVPRIYLLNSQIDFAPQLCPTGFMVAGIPNYAIYLLHRLYDPQMGLNSLQALAVYLISETASQDPKVGGPIKLAQITSSNGWEELSSERINEIVEANERQSQNLREFFFRGGASGEE